MSDHEFSLAREAALLARLGGLGRVAELLERHLGAGAVQRASEYQDKQGADGWWIRKGHRPLAIDWKLRGEDYEDLVIEWASRVEHGSPGWTTDPHKITDYVLYLWPTSARLLPFKALRDAALAHRADWELRFGVREATTEGRYTTRFTAVPDSVVLTGMNRSWEERDRLGWPLEKYAKLAWPGSTGQNPDGTWGDLGWFTKELYEYWG